MVTVYAIALNLANNRSLAIETRDNDAPIDCLAEKGSQRIFPQRMVPIADQGVDQALHLCEGENLDW